MRSELLQQVLEQQHLLGVDLLGGGPVEPPQQALELMLKLFDGAGVFLLLFEELLPLGPQEFNFLLETLPLLPLGAKRFDFLLEALPLLPLGAQRFDFLAKFEEGGG